MGCDNNTREIVGDLMKAELVAVIPGNMFRTNIQKQAWSQVMDTVRKLPDHILDMIRQAAERKDKEREKECEKKLRGKGLLADFDAKHRRVLMKLILNNMIMMIILMSMII
ncbi:hypothetical protein BD769DRAFT_1387450 [Suillus cothurnatus]|nr:hypothetical protein BD769DRAFT_1387450 [Suillus cothurnatus]